MPKAANEKFTIRKVHPVVRCDGLECQVAYICIQAFNGDRYINLRKKMLLLFSTYFLLGLQAEPRLDDPIG